MYTSTPVVLVLFFNCHGESDVAHIIHVRSVRAYMYVLYVMYVWAEFLKSPIVEVAAGRDKSLPAFGIYAYIVTMFLFTLILEILYIPSTCNV